MSKKEKEYTAETSMENVEHALSKTEQFIEDNQKILTIIIFAIIVIVGGYWGVKKLYFIPQANKAQEEMFFAQNYFEKDSFKLALNGDGMNSGFLDIVGEYGITKPGKLAKYYVGISYLRLGNFQEAIDYLSDFSCDDELLNATAKGALGDAYLETNDIDAAISNYKNATDIDNEVIAATYLLKLGLAYESQKDYNNALDAFSVIKSEYKSSIEGRNIDKYITRVQLLSAK